MVETKGSVGMLVKEFRKVLSGRYEEREVIAIVRHSFEDLKGWNAAQLADNRDVVLSAEDRSKVERILVRLSLGEPLQYVLGKAWFLGHQIEVDPSVLIPRPETEELVHHILTEGVGYSNLLDIGTGSGCIAIALKSALRNASVTGMDVSADALALARRNGLAVGVDVEWLHQDILDGTLDIGNDRDLIVSNPPYIPRAEEAGLDEHVSRHEPALALFVEDDDPLLFYRTIGSRSLNALRSEGALWFECHRSYTTSIASLLLGMGFSSVEEREDMIGDPRFVKAVR